MSTASVDQHPPAGGHRSGSAQVFQSANSLMLNTVLGAALGLAFWFAAARLYPTDVVGRDSALIASMMSLSAFCNLNLSNVVLRFLPTQRRRPARTVLVAYGIAAGATALGAGALVLITPALSDDFRLLWTHPALSLLYVFAAVAWTLFALQDAALTALRHAFWVPIKNTTYNALKLASLPLLAALGTGHGIFVAWVVPVMVMLAPVNYPMFRRLLPAHARNDADLERDARPMSRIEFLRFAAQDSAAGALNMAALTLLPLLVVVLVGSTANAHFFIPFTIVVTFDLLFLNVAASLVAEGARDEQGLPELVRSIVRRFLPPLLLGVVVLAAGAPLILAPFGADYAREGTDLLRLMALASVFRAAMALFVAVARLRRHGAAILAVQSVFSGLLIGLVILLVDPFGINGIALAWLIATTIVAVGVLPSLVRVFRATGTTVPPLTAVSEPDPVRDQSRL